MTFLNAQLVRRPDGVGNGLVLTSAGHQASLDHEYDDFVSMLRKDLAGIGATAAGAPQLNRLSTGPLSKLAHPTGPPVISWLSEPGREKFLLDIGPGLPCFQGHFPSNPIVPGIIQLHWATVLARLCLGVQGVPREVLRLKFHRIATPPLFVELQLESADPTRVDFLFISHGCTHARGTLRFDAGS